MNDFGSLFLGVTVKLHLCWRLVLLFPKGSFFSSLLVISRFTSCCYLYCTVIISSVLQFFSFEISLLQDSLAEAHK